MKTIHCVLLLLCFPLAAPGENLRWEPFTDQAFRNADKEHKLLILDLEAVWCHWCHVMEKTTYADQKVQEALRHGYITLRADQDARPDLANRYRDYGWPATIFFDAQGRELAKRAGYISPEEMLALLTKLTAHPVPEEIEESATVENRGTAALSAELKAELSRRFEDSADYKIGGLDIPQRYLDSDTVEFALAAAVQGDSKNEAYARATLNGNLELIDPVWGGAYQYSTRSGWDSPHFEKIIPTQAKNIRFYALASQILQEPKYLDASRKCFQYLLSFLQSPEGAFYTSQDADVVQGEHAAEYFALDDAARRKIGIPKIDTHRYSRENGFVISALTSLYAATLDKDILSHAQKAAQWVSSNRELPHGGYRHDETDTAGPYLADTLAMGDAFLSLYSVTAVRTYLAKSEKAAQFIAKNFSSSDGFLTAVPAPQSIIRPTSRIDENITAARYLNLLSYYTGNEQYKKDALTALHYLSRKTVALKSLTEIGIAIADEELSTPPLHLTVVGPKNNSVAAKLFEAAVSYPHFYKRIEWWDSKEGNLPNPDIQYPELDDPAAFICTNKRCSPPILDPSEIAPTISRFLGRK